MNAVRGRVHDGHIEVEGELPEGAEVIVLLPSNEAPFDLDADQLKELDARIAAADRGETQSASAVIARLRSR